MVFKKRRILNETDKWRINEKNVEVAAKFSHLIFTLENTEIFYEQKTLMKKRTCQTAVAVK
jgi:hypothetical protein